MQRRPGNSGRQKRATHGGGNTFRRGEGLNKAHKPVASASSAGLVSLLKGMFSAKGK